MSQHTTDPAAAQIALGMIGELRALLTRCAEALERQAEAAEIQALMMHSKERGMRDADDSLLEVVATYCDRVTDDLRDAYDGDQPEDDER